MRSSKEERHNCTLHTVYRYLFGFYWNKRCVIFVHTGERNVNLTQMDRWSYARSGRWSAYGRQTANPNATSTTSLEHCMLLPSVCKDTHTPFPEELSAQWMILNIFLGSARWKKNKKKHRTWVGKKAWWNIKSRTHTGRTEEPTPKSPTCIDYSTSKCWLLSVAYAVQCIGVLWPMATTP